MGYLENLISVVIITCNRKKELKKAIESCIKFADMDCEIIIVDNKSTDGTKEMISNISMLSNVTLRYFYMEYNLGVAGGRNYGFDKSNGRVIFFLDDDAYFAEDSASLSYAYNYLLKNPNIFALATEIFDKKKNSYLKDTSDKKNPSKVFSFVGASHFIRKDFVQRKDLYPDKLFYGTEERYACLCAYKQGYDIEYHNCLKVIHAPSTFTRSSEYEILRNIYVNKFIIKKLTLPRIFLIFSSIMHYLRLIKFCNINFKRYCDCYRVYKERYKDNKYATNRLACKTVILLIKRYGLYTVL